jgi:hypothetical protein
MEKLTIKQIKEIERISDKCNKKICGWCVVVKGLKNYRGEWRAPAEMRDKKRIAGAWCPFFEKFIKVLDEDENFRKTVERLPECIAACKRNDKGRPDNT